MPTLLSNTSEALPLPLPQRKRWTREQCGALEAAGLFEAERLELVDGDLISKMGKTRPHVNAFRLMQYWLLEAFGKEFVDAEAPIDVSPADNPSNEPEPDLIVLREPCDTFVSGNPKAEDLRLVVEISDSSLRFDLVTKAALYARAGIVEYWVLDVAGRSLVVHRKPESGRYQSVMVYGEKESVSPLGAGEAKFSPGIAYLG
jgi:Uma2 family endonuclease